MIKEEDYLKAKQIVQEYEKQLNISGVSGRFYTDEEIEQIEETAFRQGILDCENGGG